MPRGRSPSWVDGRTPTCRSYPPSGSCAVASRRDGTSAARHLGRLGQSRASAPDNAWRKAGALDANPRNCTQPHRPGRRVQAAAFMPLIRPGHKRAPSYLSRPAQRVQADFISLFARGSASKRATSYLSSPGAASKRSPSPLSSPGAARPSGRPHLSLRPRPSRPRPGRASKRAPSPHSSPEARVQALAFTSLFARGSASKRMPPPLSSPGAARPSGRPHISHSPDSTVQAGALTSLIRPGQRVQAVAFTSHSPGSTVQAVRLHSSFARPNGPSGLPRLNIDRIPALPPPRRPTWFLRRPPQHLAHTTKPAEETKGRRPRRSASGAYQHRGVYC